MLDVDTKRRIDTARDILVGKVPDPKSQVEQITISLIYKFMDDMDKQVEELEGKPTFFQGEFAKYSWSRIFDPRISGHELVTLYGEAIDKMNLNPNIPQLFRDIFKNAYLPYRDPETLKSFLKIINEFHYSHSEKLGDAYEYLLSILSSQGDAGQFRTPRHIIDFIVEVVSPQKTDKVLDPACGTAGFLISSYKHILKENTDKRSGDKLKPEERNNLIKNFCGYDISPDMVRISLVNMYLHGFSNPKIYEYDTLTSEERWNEYYDVILANPPFMSPKGGIKPHKKFSIQANRSEVLFVDYICEHLNPTGKAGIIVPEGIIFQSGKAYKQLRKMLVENYLWAVVSLPAGVFNPYSGVKTSILLIDKQLNKKSDSILFVKIENDGFDLGAQRREIDKNDLPESKNLLLQYKDTLHTNKTFTGENKNILLVSKDIIALKDDYNLSIDRYRVNKNIKHGNFDLVKLGDLCEFQTGSRQKGGSISKGIPSIGGEQISEDGRIKFEKMRFISEEHFSKMNSGILKKGDVLLVKDGATTGKTGYYFGDLKYAAINEHVYILRSNDKILSYFLYKLIQTYNFKEILKKYIKGIIGGISSEIREIQIPLPPLSVQQEIVNKIESYQSIINGARQVVENYKPQIDINPEWKIVELGNYISIDNGRVLTEFENNGKIACIKVSDMNLEENQIRITTSSHWIIHTSYQLLPIGSIIFPKRGAAIATNKKRITSIPCLIDNNCMGITVKSSKLNNYFLFYFFIGFDLTKISNSAGVALINNGDVTSIQLPLPPLEEQQQIVSRLNQEQKLIDANKELIKLYEQKIKDEINKVWKK